MRVENIHLILCVGYIHLILCVGYIHLILCVGYIHALLRVGCIHLIIRGADRQGIPAVHGEGLSHCDARERAARDPAVEPRPRHPAAQGLGVC